MAHSLGLGVVAEGVESLKQLAFVRKEGCDYVQGYLISRPLVAEGLGQLLASDFHLFSHLNLRDDELALPGTDSARNEAPEWVEIPWALSKDCLWPLNGDDDVVTDTDSLNVVGML